MVGMLGLEDGFRCPPDASLHSGHGAATTEPVSYCVALADNVPTIAVVDALRDAESRTARRVHLVHDGSSSFTSALSEESSTVAAI